MKRLLLLLNAVALLALACMPATAQSYPNRTVSVVVPFPAGGSVDVVARLLVQKLNESMARAVRSVPTRWRRPRPTATR